MQAQIKIPIPTQRRVLKVGKEMVNCSSARGNLWQQIRSEVLNRQERSVISTWELAAAGYQGYPERPETPEDSEVQNPKVEFGHILSVYH